MVDLKPTILTTKCNRAKQSVEKTGIIRWEEKQDPAVCRLQETHFKCKDTEDTAQGQKGTYPANMGL